MGKDGELWDDSALVDAFDRAVASYKEMHGKKTQATPCRDEKPELVAATAEEQEHISADATDEHRKKDDNCNHIPCGATETPQKPSEERQTIEQASLQGTEDKGIHVSESKTHSSDVADADGNVSSGQQTWEYNELLRQYYELEEQSRNVLQQLQQTNYWSYQAPGYASADQRHVPVYSATAPDPHSSTSQTPSCCWNVPMVSVACCSAGQPSGSSACMPPSAGCSVSVTCDQCPGASATYPTFSNFMQLPTKVSTNVDEVTKAAMMTAEGALNFMRSTISGEPGSQRKESETGKENSSMGTNLNFETTGADSDLAVVLNAWFAAGFHTGRYLTQQSMKNSQQ